MTIMAGGGGGGGGEVPTEEESSASQHSAGDRLLLATCRAIKKQTGWQHRTLRTACDWATGENFRQGACMQHEFHRLVLPTRGFLNSVSYVFHDAFLNI